MLVKGCRKSSFGSVSTPNTSCTFSNLFTHSILVSSSSCFICLTWDTWSFNLENSALYLMSYFLMQSLRIVVSLSRYLWMSIVCAFAISNIVSCSDFRIETSFLPLETSAANAKISSSICSIALLKLKGSFDNVLNFDY